MADNQRNRIIVFGDGDLAFVAWCDLDNIFTGDNIFRVDSETAFSIENTNGYKVIDIDTVNEWFKVGADPTADNTDALTSAYFTRNQNGYHAVNVINVNDGGSASADLVLLNDSDTNYGEIGLNSTNYSDASYAFFTPDSFVAYGVDGDTFVGTGNSAKKIYFFVGDLADASSVRGYIDTDGLHMPVISPLSIKTDNYTAQTTDEVIELSVSGKTITLPTASVTGKKYVIINSSSGDITVSSASVIGNTGSDTSLTVGTGNATTLISNGTQWRII
jgi:hypothetical protein